MIVRLRWALSAYILSLLSSIDLLAALCISLSTEPAAAEADVDDVDARRLAGSREGPARAEAVAWWKGADLNADREHDEQAFDYLSARLLSNLGMKISRDRSVENEEY